METLENWDGEWTTAEPPHLNAEEKLLQTSSTLDYVYGVVPRAAGGGVVDTSADSSGALWSVVPASKSTPPTSINIINHSGGGGSSSSRKRRRRDPEDKCSAEDDVGSGNSISFQKQGAALDRPDAEAIQQMKEMIYRAAALRPVSLGEAEAAPPRRRKNVRISADPQTVAARQRRERISDRLRVLQTLVPGGSKLDTASMLDEAANYLKFLRSQVKALQAMPPPPPNYNTWSPSSSNAAAITVNINGLTFNFSSFPSSYGGHAYNNTSININ